MRFSTHINNKKCLEWGLNAPQGALFDLLNQLSSWADEVVCDGVIYYFIHRDKIIEELPLFYTKDDTVYRNLKVLFDKGLIHYRKDGKKDLVRLTEKGKGWNDFANSEINSSSEINPTFDPKLGKKSDQNSEKNPSSPIPPYMDDNNTTGIIYPPIVPPTPKIPSAEEIELEKVRIAQFEDFWNHYTPIRNSKGKFVAKGSKSEAQKRYIAALKTGEEHETIMRGLAAYLGYCKQTDAPSCGAEVFINQRRWQNDYSGDQCVNATTSVQGRNRGVSVVEIAARVAANANLQDGDGVPR